MMQPVPQDTPFNRVSISSLTHDQLITELEALQARRLKAYNIYQEAQRLKQETKDGKLAAQLEKRCEQFKKVHDSVTKALEKLDMYAIDIQALRISAGDL